MNTVFGFANATTPVSEPVAAFDNTTAVELVERTVVPSEMYVPYTRSPTLALSSSTPASTALPDSIVTPE